MLINFHLTLFEAESLKQKTPLRMKSLKQETPLRIKDLCFAKQVTSFFQAESPASGTPRNTRSDTEHGVSETEDSAKNDASIND